MGVHYPIILGVVSSVMEKMAAEFMKDRDGSRTVSEYQLHSYHAATALLLCHVY